MKSLMAMLVVCCLFAGCSGPNDKHVVEANKVTLSKDGDLIGELPDGRKVYRYEIDRGDSSSHWLYVVDGSISINHAVRSGKTTRTATEILIDGTVFVPKETP